MYINNLFWMILPLSIRFFLDLQVSGFEKINNPNPTSLKQMFRLLKRQQLLIATGLWGLLFLPNEQLRIFSAVIIVSVVLLCVKQVDPRANFKILIGQPSWGYWPVWDEVFYWTARLWKLLLFLLDSAWLTLWVVLAEDGWLGALLAALIGLLVILVVFVLLIVKIAVFIFVPSFLLDSHFLT